MLKHAQNKLHKTVWIQFYSEKYICVEVSVYAHIDYCVYSVGSSGINGKISKNQALGQKWETRSWKNGAFNSQNQYSKLELVQWAIGEYTFRYISLKYELRPLSSRCRTFRIFENFR